MLRLTIGVGYLLAGAGLWMAPYFSRREYFFAVRVPEGFRRSPEARRAAREYRAVLVAAVIVGLCAHLALPARMLPGAAPVVSYATILIAGIAFYRQHRSLKSLATPTVSARQVELTGQPERLPWFAWLGLAPPVLIAAVALLFHAEMRDVKGASGALIYGGEWSAYLAVVGLAT